MAYVAPDTTIYVCAGVPLDATYEHTLYFATEAAAATYFTSKAIATFSNQSYQRVRRGWLRIAANAGDLYHANYLCWKNGDAHSLSSGKWFFAFVTSVEYVNETTTEIAFELDVMQTWAANYTLGECFVDREHSSLDVAGFNTVPENLELGEYVYGQTIWFGSGGENIIIIAASVENNQTLDPVQGDMYTGIYSGIKFHHFSDATGANQFIQRCTTALKDDAIVAIFMVPNIFDLTSITTVYNTDVTVPGVMDVDSYGYTPRNQKLYTYPYQLLYVWDGNGHGAQYRYELFDPAHGPSFRVSGVLGCPPEFRAAPRYYKGQQIFENDGLKLSSFPLCCYTTDAYKAWLAQNRTRLQTGGVSAALGIASSVATAAATLNPLPLVGAASSLLGAMSLMAEKERASCLPPQAHGNTGSGAVELATDSTGWNFSHAHIRVEYMRIIDDYFDKFGYATHRLKVPNRNVRPHWTYTRTVGCTLSQANMPADDARKICAIYDKGITFWINPTEVGNYALDNSPASSGQEVGGSNGTT